MSWMPEIARSSRRAVEGRLDLARHQLRRRVADEVAHVGADVRRRVEDLVLADAGERVGGDVADRVAAALARGQADRRDLADQLRHLIERDVMDLDVLTRRDVRLVQRRVALGDVRERVHLLGRDPAERQLHAHHLDVRLALAVDALLQAEADELVLRRVTREELAGLTVEVVELVLEDRDDVAGDVLDDLRIGQRSGAAVGTRLRGRRFHGTKYTNPGRDLGFGARRRNDAGPPIGGPAPQSLRRMLRRRSALADSDDQARRGPTATGHRESGWPDPCRRSCSSGDRRTSRDGT